jgi:hypothetical protein
MSGRSTSALDCDKEPLTQQGLGLTQGTQFDSLSERQLLIAIDLAVATVFLPPRPRCRHATVSLPPDLAVATPLHLCP